MRRERRTPQADAERVGAPQKILKEDPNEDPKEDPKRIPRRILRGP